MENLCKKTFNNAEPDLPLNHIYSQFFSNRRQNIYINSNQNFQNTHKLYPFFQSYPNLDKHQKPIVDKYGTDNKMEIFILLQFEKILV